MNTVENFTMNTFAVKLDRCVGSCNTLNDLSHKAYVPNKTEDLNLSVFNMITGINESKKSPEYMTSEYKCRLGERICNSDQWWNNDKCRCECKKCHVCEKYYSWNPATCNCENGKYFAGIMDDSVITCDVIIESNDKETKTNFNRKKATCKTPNSYILLEFSLITTSLLIAVSIYCYLVKYRGNQKHLLPLHFTNYKLKV